VQYVILTAVEMGPNSKY